MKAWKVTRNVLLGLAGLVILLLVTFQVLLRPKVLTGIANNLASTLVPEGNVEIGIIKAHVIKSFPNLNIYIEDIAITYPHERYARYDSIYAQSGGRRNLLRAGNGAGGIDTLLSAGRISASVDYMAFTRGRLHIRKANLEHPRIFAHYFDSTAANWDILPIGGGEKDTTSKETMPIRIDKVALGGKPLVVFTNPADTLMASLRMRRLTLDGTLNLTKDFASSKARFAIDSLSASGRLPKDTLSLRLERLRMDVHNRNVILDAEASARLRTGSFGRLRLPVRLKAEAYLPKCAEGEIGANIRELEVGLSALTLTGQGDILKKADGTMDMDVSANIKDCPIGDIIEEYRENFPFLKKLETNAKLSLAASAKGSYGGGKMPQVNARLKVPESDLDYEDLGRKGRVALDITADTQDMEKIDARVNRLFLDFAGAKANLSARAADVLGKDPLIYLDGTARARVDSITSIFTREAGIYGTGTLMAKLSGRARLKQLDMAKIGNAVIDCTLSGEDLSISMPSDSLQALIPRIDVQLQTKANEIDPLLKKGARVLALKADADTLDASLGDMFIRGGGVSILMQNSADVLSGLSDRSSIMGIIKARSLRLRDSDGLRAGISDNTERFRYEPATEGRPVPRMSLTSKSGRVGIGMGTTRAGLRDLSLEASASRHIRRQQAARPRPPRRDSTARVPIRDEFAAADISISLSESIRKYFRDWDINGNIALENARVRIPAFPLRSGISKLSGSFNNDTLNVKNITVTAGKSDLSASACLSGIKRSVLSRSGRARLKLTAEVKSNLLDVNELLRGYAYYVNYEDTLSNKKDDIVDEIMEESVVVVEDDVVEDAKKGSLIIIPSNLDVDFTLEASRILYDSLDVNWAAADIKMKDRTVQITNALAATNMGDMYVEGFYSTRSKDDIKAGFDLNLVDITAEKVITLFPAIDTIMPMLKSFAGDLDCELAATTSIDMTMRLILPSIDGVMRISGKDLTLESSDALAKITSLLKFKNKDEIRIDNMAVSGIVQDNLLEVFPFVLDIDRYQLAASGTQHLDSDFSYHLSVIKSPLVVKFGVNAWGPDFDHIHYGVGKAKYKSANVPVYTKQLDTVQFSLVAAIHNIFEKGVDKAMRENREAAAAIGPAPSVELPAEGEPVEAPETSQIEALVEDVNESVASRREALKQEILRLEKKYSAQ